MDSGYTLKDKPRGFPGRLTVNYEGEGEAGL